MNNFNTILNRLETSTGLIPSKYQHGFFHWLMEEEGNAMVEAVAGSGKTTTLEQGLFFVPPTASVAMVAFNKHIAEELQVRISKRGLKNATGRTFHSLGFQACRQMGQIKLNDSKTFYTVRELTGYNNLSKERQAEIDEVAQPICQLVGLFKGFGVGPITPYPDEDAIVAMAAKYEIELPEVTFFYELLKDTFDACVNNKAIIDYNDMIYMPLAYNLNIPTFDFIFVDECQDLNISKIHFAARMMKKTSRIAFVGDRSQMIYSWSGADHAAMDTIASLFNVTKLPLSICYRCPVSVVNVAKAFCPQIEAAPNAKPGKVETIKHDDMLKMVSTGDFILSRVTAPLVSLCLQFIRDGKKAVVKGKDIGVGLISLLNKADKSPIGRQYADIWQKIDAYGSAEIDKINRPGNESRVMSLTDRIDTLKVLAEGCTTIKCLIDKINLIFSDFNAGITLSTIHKAKGLEADTVFIIRPDLLPHPMAKQDWQKWGETCCQLVACTRSKNNLYYVLPKEGMAE